MDALHVGLWGLGLTALLALAGVVWLLLQRGALAAQVATAQSEARAAEARAVAAESELARSQAALREAETRVGAALQDAARFSERVSALAEARESDQRDAARALTEAVDAERRVHREQLDALARVHDERLASVTQAKQEIAARLREFDEKMTSSFGKLAADALAQSSGQFLKLAEERMGAVKTEAANAMGERARAVEDLVRPIAESLKRTDDKLSAIEKERGSAYAGLMEQVRAMQDQGTALRAETGKLVRALGKPDVRGRAGEWQLRRVVELAGLVEGRDFSVQDATVDADGNALKPDMVIYLPHSRHLVIDAKTNIAAYLDAIDADGAQREACLERFTGHVAAQVAALGKKNYWRSYEGSPEFVVMFIPGDQYLDAALSRRADLVELAIRARVILATPTTLLGLVHAVALALQEHKLAAEAVALRELGAKLHERVQVALSYAVGLGKAINASVERYNEFIASAERNLLSTARRFEKEGVKSGKALQTDEAMTPIVVRAQLPTKAAAMLPFDQSE